LVLWAAEGLSNQAIGERLGEVVFDEAAESGKSVRVREVWSEEPTGAFPG
jgi:hypothetical protein